MTQPFSVFGWLVLKRDVAVQFETLGDKDLLDWEQLLNLPRLKDDPAVSEFLNDPRYPLVLNSGDSDFTVGGRADHKTLLAGLRKGAEADHDYDATTRTLTFHYSTRSNATLKRFFALLDSIVDGHFIYTSQAHAEQGV